MYSLVLSGTPGKRGPSELEEPEEALSLYRREAEKLEIKVEQKHGNPKTEERGAYSTRRRIAGGALEGPSSGRLEPAIATGRPRVFCWRKKRGGSVANGDLLPIQGRKVIFMAQSG